MASPAHPIPAFYRIFFTSIDPLIALSGAYMNIFDPYTILRSLFPESHPAYNVTPTHTMLLQQFAGAFVMMAFCMVTMLRYTKDVGVWKFFEAGILITDFGSFWSVWTALESQGRFNLQEIRWEEWGTVAILGFVTVVRIAFLAGLGFGTTAASVKKRN